MNKKNYDDIIIMTNTCDRVNVTKILIIVIVSYAYHCVSMRVTTTRTIIIDLMIV